MNGCAICGGTAGSFNPATHAHYLCEARKTIGAPTPSLGNRCPSCNGTGIRAGFKGGVMLSLEEGPARIKRSIEAQFPPCPDCVRGVAP